MSYIHKVLIPPASNLEGDIVLEKTNRGIQFKAVGSLPSLHVASIPYEANVTGPKSINFNTPTAYEITNYDDSVTYTVTSNNGVVSRNGSTITFSCTNEVLTTSTFTVNGKNYVIDMIPTKPVAPTITSPVNGATNVYPDKITVTTSAFQMNVGSSTDTHLSTDWEVATDPDFNNIVFSRYGSTADKTSITLPD